MRLAALLLAAVLLCASPSLAARDFAYPAAGVYGRIQLLRGLERQLLAAAEQPARAAFYLRKRQEARVRIDELMREAHAAAGSAGQHRQLDTLAVLVRLADARFAEVLAAGAGARKPVASL